MSKNDERRVKEAELRDFLIDQSNLYRKLDRRLINRRVASAAGREQVFLDQLAETLNGILVPALVKKATPYKGKKKKVTQRILNIILSDLHYQSLLDPREVPLKFGPVEEARRTACVGVEVADYKRQYRPETTLRVHLIGDIIQGLLHDMREAAPLSIQFAAAVRYLTQLVLFWASEFQQVDVDCTPGNHGRITSRHPDRAVFQKFDAIETMIYFAMKTAVAAAGAKNVRVNIGRRPYYVVDLFDKKGFFTHGDTVLKIGHPGSTINTKELTHKIMKWNASQGVGGPFDLFAVGHHHVATTTYLPKDVGVIVNGCLIPPDSFSLSIDSPDVTCGQYMFESVPGHAMGDQRFIKVGGADTASELDAIITPFTDF